MEAVCSSGTSVDSYRTTRRDVPKGSTSCLRLVLSRDMPLTVEIMLFVFIESEGIRRNIALNGEMYSFIDSIMTKFHGFSINK
jgi:hypothetical protein